MVVNKWNKAGDKVTKNLQELQRLARTGCVHNRVPGIWGEVVYDVSRLVKDNTINSVWETAWLPVFSKTMVVGNT
jgi:hypothetical protein